MKTKMARMCRTLTLLDPLLRILRESVHLLLVSLALGAITLGASSLEEQDAMSIGERRR